jgi:hypothetical protein
MEMVDDLGELLCLCCATKQSICRQSRLVSAEGPEALGEALQLKRLSICSQSIGHILVASKDLSTSGCVNKAFQDSQNNGKKLPLHIGTNSRLRWR